MSSLFVQAHDDGYLAHDRSKAGRKQGKNQYGEQVSCGGKNQVVAASSRLDRGFVELENVPDPHGNTAYHINRGDSLSYATASARRGSNPYFAV